MAGVRRRVLPVFQIGLPAELRRREYVIGVIRGVYERYGFEPLETPAFENIETLLGRYGEEGNKLIFKILKRGVHESTGEADLALRYDLTVPLARVVAPRFWGGVISMPLLAALFSAFGIFGGYVVGVRLIGIDAGAFWGQMKAGVDVWPDVTNGIIKSFVFGIAVSLIAVFEGYDAKPTAEGVSSATTRTVVMSSLMILALDFVMTVFMFRGASVI